MAQEQENKQVPLEVTEVGTIIDIKRDVITIDGLPNCVYGELLEFDSGDRGIVIEFDKEKVVALLVGSGINTKTGDKAVSKASMFKVPVCDGLIGRVVNGLVQPVDGRGPLKTDTLNPVFRDAPAIMSRVPIEETLRTGVKIVDSMIPIGKGQRELIIGDRQTGKTTIAMDTVINQKHEDVICIYCWIGGSYNSMLKIIETLNVKGAMGHTIFVAAPASTSATEQYLAPYVATAIGEYFMDKKKDVFIVYDNLTKHAWIYRQISLLLNRSPGREAYPGDIFYIHSQLVERAARMNPETGGSITCFPIIDTLQGDVTGYVQTNLISMTDGQIYTSAPLFNEGFKPAVDIGLSVSRIGSKVQSKGLREVSAKLRLEYAQYKELEKLTKLRAKISPEMQAKIQRGRTLSNILIQPAYSPVSELEKIIVFYAFNNNMLNDCSRAGIAVFQQEITGFLREKDNDMVSELERSFTLTDNIRQRLDQLIDEYLSMGRGDRRQGDRRSDLRADVSPTGRRTE